MAKNSTVKLGNVPFSSNSNTRYKQSKTATFSKTFNGCTYIRLSGSVRLETTPSEVSGYNFIEIVESDGMAVRGFITGIEYINEHTTRIDFKIDGWETFKNSVVFKKSYIERLSAGATGSEYTYVLPEPYTSNRYTSYGDTKYDITGYKYIIATLHLTSLDLYNDAMRIGANPLDGEGAHYHKIDYLTESGGVMLSGIYHGCDFVVADNVDTANKYISALIKSGYESSILNVFSVPSALVTANGTKTKTFSYTTYLTPIAVGDYRTSSCTVLADSNIMCLLGTVTAPAANYSSLCKYKKIANSPYTFLRVTTPTGQSIDFDYDDFTDDVPEFGVYGAIGFNSEILLVPKNYQGIQYNFHKAIAIQCNQTGMYSSSAFASWAEAQQLKYLGTAIGTLTTGITAALTANYTALAATVSNAGLTALNQMQERSIARKSISTVGSASGSDFAFCHPQSSCFKLSCMSLRPIDAENLSAYIDNYGYSVSIFDTPDTNFIAEDVYIKCNNVQLNVNCPDSYASEIRNLFNAGCRFI